MVRCPSSISVYEQCGADCSLYDMRSTWRLLKGTYLVSSSREVSEYSYGITQAAKSSLRFPSTRRSERLYMPPIPF